MMRYWVMLCCSGLALAVSALALAEGADIPEPVSPVYTKLKDLHRDTALVKDGQPNVTIITSASGEYDALAAGIQQAIEGITGVRVPIAKDDSPAAGAPIAGNLIALGNRSTNKTIEELYNRYFCILDLKYPGPEGYTVRTLHNPFGNGYNVVLVGGSDDAGTAAGAKVFIEKTKASRGKAGTLSIGWLMEIKLGKGISPPASANYGDVQVWDAAESDGEGFGWNSISKNMAIYYMTGQPSFAREALRLAFPDEKAKQELFKTDVGVIFDMDDPLAGPYHYKAHLMVLLWDLIEESPVFSDEERLKVTNGFSRQLTNGSTEVLGIYPIHSKGWGVGNRHNDWAAICLYVLGRYFQKDYPDPVWEQCVRASQGYFAVLHDPAYIGGMGGNLRWICTVGNDICTYLVLSGDREAVRNGALETILRSHQLLMTGEPKEPALREASIAYLNMAGYLMQDGRWRSYLERTRSDTNIFRLGQSYWPEDDLKPAPSLDPVGRWSVNYLSDVDRDGRKTGFAHDQSFYFAGYRSTLDGTGDLTLVHGCRDYERDRYHTFALIGLRLAGRTLFRADQRESMRNQLIVRVNGLVDPNVPLDAALSYADVVGETAAFVADVPNAPYCDWQRTLAQRTGKYLLVLDEVTFRADNQNASVETSWATAGEWDPAQNALVIGPADNDTRTFEIIPSERVYAYRAGPMTLASYGSTRKGESRCLFSLIGARPEQGGSLACLRLADNAASLALPQPGLAVAGSYDMTRADLAILAADHLFGRNLSSAGVGAALLTASKPVDADWDFETGQLNLVVNEPTDITLAVDEAKTPTLDGGRPASSRAASGGIQFTLSPGRHLIAGARPPAGLLQQLTRKLGTLLAEARAKRSLDTTSSGPVWPKAPQLQTAFAADVGSGVVDLGAITSEGKPRLFAVADKAIHLLAPDGTEQQSLQADAKIRKAAWWPEHRLLLAGCVDEKVIAFDEAGNRKWVFTSEMSPELLRTGTYYAFKSWRGHEGIHGLSTGVFYDGKSQTFVGSASTVEILDENGKLMKRAATLFADGSAFQVVDAPDGSRNLLIGFELTGSREWLYVLNDKTGEVSRGGAFTDLPPGHTDIASWIQTNRPHVFYEDLTGSGTKWVVSEMNGIWNRVGVWDNAGSPLYCASFGPGEGGDGNPYPNMRGLEVVDLDGDGKKEIITATASGLVVALDYQCQVIWTRRLPSAPTVLKAVIPAMPASKSQENAKPLVFVGCDDGTVIALDGKGEPVGLGKVTGSPTCIAELVTEQTGPMALVATDTGQIKGFTQ